ncbi:MAG TPA: hypothetical protein VGL91_23415, partial [Acidobacteriota bacterium]
LCKPFGFWKMCGGDVPEKCGQKNHILTFTSTSTSTTTANRIVSDGVFFVCVGVDVLVNVNVNVVVIGF